MHPAESWGEQIQHQGSKTARGWKLLSQRVALAVREIAVAITQNTIYYTGQLSIRVMGERRWPRRAGQ